MGNATDDQQQLTPYRDASHRRDRRTAMIRRQFIALHSLLLAACAAAVPLTWDLPDGVRPHPVNGYPMAALARGSGTPVVLVHGTTTDYRWWAPQMEPLAERYRPVAVSLRHYYPERWNGQGGTLSMPQHVDDLATFIRALDAGPVHLVGWSRGGQAALQMAARHPQLLKSLVLIDPAPVASLLPATSEAAVAIEKRHGFVRAAIQHLERGEIDAGLERFVDGTSAAGAWKALPEPVKQSVRDSAWSIKSLPDDAAQPLRCDDLKTIDMPVLLVNGERSPTEYKAMAQAVQGCVMRSERAVIPNAAHAMTRGNAPAFNAALLGFLAQH
jgi:esterase